MPAWGGMHPHCLIVMRATTNTAVYRKGGAEAKLPRPQRNQVNSSSEQQVCVCARACDGRLEAREAQAVRLRDPEVRGTAPGALDRTRRHTVRVTGTRIAGMCSACTSVR